MQWLWGSKPPRLEPVEGDIVYPTHFMDNKAIFDGMLLASAWQFNDVLDADKLHGSFCRLLEIGDWRKLGGRFRRPPGQRSWELHVPAEFTPERPAVVYTHEVFDVKVQEHPLARQIPRPSTGGPKFHPSPVPLRPLMVRPGAAETMEEFLSRDDPALALHIASFQDGTIVSLTWPHCLMDMMGLKSLVEAWSLVLAGREAELPVLAGAREDILYESTNLDLAKKETSVIEQDRLDGFRIIFFALCLLWDIIWNRIEARILYLPKKTVENLRSEGLRDIIADSKPDAETPWISESDALLATWAKALAQSQPSPRPIIAMNPFDMRGRAPGFSNSGQEVYIQNVVTESFTTLPTSLLSSSIGQIALSCRRSLQEQIAPAQILALLRSLRQLWDSGKDVQILSGPANATLLVTTNWARGNLFHIADFGPAVVKQGEGESERTNPVGMSRFFVTIPLKLSPTARNSMTQLGKDHDGNTWVMGLFNLRTWKAIETLVEGYS
ncbi:unnamed protein product [Clonostachys rhizophaga]|uniref:Uncharacterized protein n=1 Tax=Clonostachys rhizophaga TaxID=160324 RepID=A0A9N9YWQ6_9HYPO|nr:unnamed protein product [Clonostachys rhizophaga]